MLCGVLRQGGHKPVAAFDAMQALMFAMRTPVPELVLLDINMPAGTGIQTLTKLKNSSKTAHIPVIVISGSTDPKAPEQVSQLGAVRYLTKPVDPALLLQTVNEVMAEAGH
jgi:putative two-component system response regulator